MEYFFTCPYCWKEISFLIDTSVESQKYVEDCEICCNPIEVSYEIIDNSVSFFEAVKLQ